MGPQASAIWGILRALPRRVTACSAAKSCGGDSPGARAGFLGGRRWILRPWILRALPRGVDVRPVGPCGSPDSPAARTGWLLGPSSAG